MVLKRKSGVARLESRRRKEAVDSLEQIFGHINETFAFIHPVRQVILLFGPTIITPKEFYVLQFPTRCYDGNILHWKSCRTAFFHKLVASDIFSHAKDLNSMVKLTVMVEAPRECDAAAVGLIPKPMFKVPTRGTRFQLNFLCKGKVVNPDFSHVSDTSFDMSGIEPIEGDSPTAEETSIGAFIPSTIDSDVNTIIMDMPSKQTYSTDNVINRCTHGADQSALFSNHWDASSKELVEEAEEEITFNYRPGFETSDPLQLMGAQGNWRTSDNIPGEIEYMWFQVPTLMKGYRDKTSKVACCDTATL